MTSQQHAPIADWLSHLEASPLLHVLPSTAFSSPSPDSLSSADSQSSRKRKPLPENSDSPVKKLRPAKLTHQTLRAMDGSQDEQGQASDEQPGKVGTESPYTPRKPPPPSSSTSKSHTKKTIKTPSSKTPSTFSNKASEARLPRNILTVRESLARHGMRIHDRAAWDRCSEFRRKIEKLFTRERPSRMSETSAKAAVKALYRHYAQNEKTLFREFRPHVIKSTRTVSTRKHDTEGEIIRLLKAYDDDGLMVIEDCPFVKDMVPGKNYTSEEKAMGLTDPKPDLTYGIQKPDFPDVREAKLRMKCQAWRSVAPGMDWPFFVVEHKGCEDSIAQAENQAIPDGAVLVNGMYSMSHHLHVGEEVGDLEPPAARKKLNEELQPANHLRPVGADEGTFVFSCPWQSDQAKIYVHWFERLEDGTEIFQMSRIKGYQMEDEEDLADMRRDVHNILDWGLFEFRPAAEDVWRSLLARA